MEGVFEMKIFNVIATALAYFLAGISFTAGMWALMFVWFGLGTASLFICMWG